MVSNFTSLQLLVPMWRALVGLSMITAGDVPVAEGGTSRHVMAALGTLRSVQRADLWGVLRASSG